MQSLDLFLLHPHVHFQTTLDTQRYKVSQYSLQFTFTKKEGENEWEVKSGDLYLIHEKIGQEPGQLFSQTAGTILFTPTTDGRFNICRKSGGRYLIFHSALQSISIFSPTGLSNV